MAAGERQMLGSIPNADRRTTRQLREHYEIEKELANRLRAANKPDRQRLYAAVYDELFQRVPDHPQLTARGDGPAREETVRKQMVVLQQVLKPGAIFMEIGAGDCYLSLRIAGLAERVYAIDVSKEIVTRADTPVNFDLVFSDGCSIPVPSGCVDVAYSNALMEHLHPDDAFEELRNIYAALVPGGIYVCNTPNRISGPHDISKYFDTRATGFHLKEYTYRELVETFRAAGFSRLWTFVRLQERVLFLPLTPFLWLEDIVASLPSRVSRCVGRWFPVRALLGCRLVAAK